MVLVSRGPPAVSLQPVAVEMNSNRSFGLSLGLLFTSTVVIFFANSSFNPVMASAIEDETIDSTDLTTVTWAHAVNSKQKLREAIQNETIQMIEADILMGTVRGSNRTQTIPIMAHPPQNTSDLSLEEFLNTSQESLTGGKGIKLDFKSTVAFEASLDLLTRIFNEREHDFPIWLNADILSGPGAREVNGVNPNLFLSSCSTRFPLATVSVGWTTSFGSTDDHYLPTDIDRMTEVLNKNCVMQPVTFAVRAAFAANSHDALVALIRSSTETATLTIWNSSPDDITDMDALRELVNDVGRDRVYLDLPPDMYEAFKSASGNVLSKCALVAATTLLAFGNCYSSSH